MEIQEILKIVKAFFDAILKVFESLGLIKKEEAEGNEETTVA